MRQLVLTVLPRKEVTGNGGPPSSGGSGCAPLTKSSLGDVSQGCQQCCAAAPVLMLFA